VFFVFALYFVLRMLLLRSLGFFVCAFVTRHKKKSIKKTEKEGEAVATCLRLLFKRQIMKTRRWLLTTTTTGDDSFVIVQLTPGKIQINCHQNGANNAAEIKSHR